LETIEGRRADAASQLGLLAASVSKCVAKLEQESVPKRLWDEDSTLWTTDPKGQAEIRKRLGWLRLPETSKELLPKLSEFGDQFHYEGIQRVLLLGMGGSSLAPEVMSSVFAHDDPAAAEGRPCLAILDSTDPAQVAQAAEGFPPKQSVYIVSSKSGGTAETLAVFEYFWELSGGDGSRFIAITDPHTSLEKLAKKRKFRAIFQADPNVGGRYSALTAFGLVPACLLGLNLKTLLGRAERMMEHSKGDLPAVRNPGLVLGAVMAEAALAGRDKLTILADEPLAAFGSWLEQLIAESSGKDGKGIIPVDQEPLGAARVYGKDRLFVYLRLNGELDDRLEALRSTGQPVLDVPISDTYDLGAEFYRWEVATAIACHILGVNAFDQPDVQDSKDRTEAKIDEYRKKGSLQEGEYTSLKDAKSALKAFLRGKKKNDYLAVNAYLPRNADMIFALQDLRVALRGKTKNAITLGFGPRFLHSTGQLHKGGPDNGLFLQITANPVNDIKIPSNNNAKKDSKKDKPSKKGNASRTELTFGALEHAQALGDYEALVARERRVLRLHLSNPDEVGKIIKLI
jgi:transaldolase/glucose-6-phosphate isomerase